MIYYTSDTHFGHNNVIKLDNRPFRNKWQMYDELINRWNEVVKSTDTVYHLGDLSFMSASATKDIVSNLYGIKFLIRGNHDGSKLRAERMGFAAVYDELLLEDEGQLVYLVHSPTGYGDHEDRELVKPDATRTVIHGHVHTYWKTAVVLKDGYRYVNAGTMWWDYEPVPLWLLLCAADLREALDKDPR